VTRIARLVVPGVPHLVTQRGNRHGQTFFADSDYLLYLALLAEATHRAGTEIWAYCLMPNHVHLILNPGHADGLRATFADLHRRYTGAINARHGWTGHLWQGRFASVAMDEHYLLDALRYVLLNPLRAGLVRQLSDWPWSSVAAYFGGRDERLVKVAPVLARISDVAAYLAEPHDMSRSFSLIRQAETTGRPLGSSSWIEQLEHQSGRMLAARKRGPKPRHRQASEINPL
jgi:putative transposase